MLDNKLIKGKRREKIAKEKQQQKINFWQHKTIICVENWFKIVFVFPIVRKRAKKKIAKARQLYRDNHNSRILHFSSFNLLLSSTSGSGGHHKDFKNINSMLI